MTDFVAADAQFSTAQVLRPFDGFIDRYQNQLASAPIAFPGGLDPDAGKTGFDADLIRGVSVAYGSKISLWIPTVATNTGAGVEPYNYYLVWRLRNIRDFRNNRTAYHLPRQSFGANNQFVLPVSINILAYEESLNQIDPSGTVQQPLSATRLIPEAAVPLGAIGNLGMGGMLRAPILPNGNQGSFGQGVFPDVAANKTVRYSNFQVDCQGDELIILATRNNISLGNWDFLAPDGVDYNFGQLYGSDARDVGIYLLTGTNP